MVRGDNVYCCHLSVVVCRVKMFTVVYLYLVCRGQCLLLCIYLSVVVQYCMDGVVVLCICWTPETGSWNGSELRITSSVY